MLTALRLINIAIWSGLFIYMMFGGAWAAVTGKGVRRADPMRLSVAAVCIIVVLGNVRWLIAPDNEAMLFGLSALTMLVGLYKFVLAHTYGRGPKL